MSKGRPPTPNALKRLRGTDQPVRMRDESQIEILTKVATPKVLTTTRAKKIFKDKAAQLIFRKMLTVHDIEQLTTYAYSLDILFTCMKELEVGIFKPLKDDKGRIYKYIENPYLALYRQMVEITSKIGADFGFTPVSRMKLKLNNETKTQALEEFLL